MNSRVSSSVSTGGGGTAFEQQVGAMCLSCLLVHECYLGFANCRVEEVRLQTSLYDYETDDILVVGSTGQGEQCRVAIQAKLKFRFGASSPHCIETFQKFWKDFNAPDRFDPAKDILLLVTASGTNTLQSLKRLLDLSRHSSGTLEFQLKLNTPGFMDSDVLKCHDVIRSIVEKIDSADDEKFWRFLRTVHVHFTGLSISPPPEWILHLLTKYVQEHDQEKTAVATWHELLSIASEGAPNAVTMARSDLPEEMLQKYGVCQNPATRILTDHSQIILDNIRSDIAGQITLPRRETINNALSKLEENRVVAIAGPPGAGKSALAKSVIEHSGTDCMCLSFRAEEFGESHIDRALPKPILSWQFKSIVCSQQKVIIHVESFERLFDRATHTAFSDLVGIVSNCPNASLLLTGRVHAIDKAMNEFFNDDTLTCGIVQAPPLNNEETEQVAEALPELRDLLMNTKLRQLLSRPHFIDMAARLVWPDRQGMSLDVRAFREKYWNDVVRKNGATGGLPDRREAALIGLALKRARELRPFVGTDEIDLDALDALYNDGIVTKEKMGLAAPAHDVIEDFAIMRWADKLAAIHEWQAVPIAEDAGQHPAVLRVFREWLKERLDDNDEHAKNLARSAYKDTSLLPRFRDAVLASILLSDHAGDFAFQQRESLLADNAHLLINMTRLVRAVCTKLPEIYDAEDLPIQMLVPDGKAWPLLLGLIADNVDTLLPAHAEPILELVEDWSLGASANCPTPDGGASVGIIVDRLLEQTGGDGKTDIQRRALNVLVRVPRCNERRFLGLMGQSDGSSESGTLFRKLAELLIYGGSGVHVCKEFPEEMSRFTLSWCCLSKEDLSGFSGIGTSGAFMETKFGLRPGPVLDISPSAFKGPFAHLLLDSPEIGLRLVLDLVNHAGRWYELHKDDKPFPEPLQSISISVPGHGKVVQRANERLWLAYRGTSVFPVILQCALMALEYWLLRLCNKSLDVGPNLLGILGKSNNVMTTAVVASICNAYPYLCGKAAIPILESRKCVELDSVRAARELDANPLLVLRRAATKNTFYDNEREKSNELQHRQHDLLTLSLILQSNGYTEQVQNIIDAHLAELPDDASKTESDKGWELMLYQMDLRNVNFQKTTPVQGDASSERESGPTMAVSFKTERMGKGLQDYVAAADEERRRVNDAVSLWHWATTRLQNNPINGDSKEWKTVLSLAKQVQQTHRRLGIATVPPGGPEMVAAVCVRDHLDELAVDDQTWCVETLVSEVGRDSDSELPGVTASKNQASPDVLAAHTLPKVLAADPDNRRVVEAVARAITHASDAVLVGAAFGVAAYLGARHSDLMLRCAGAVAMRANLLTEYEQRHHEQTPELADMRSVQQFVSQARKAFVNDKIDPELEVNKLDLTSSRGKYTSEIILRMLIGATDLELTKDLFIRAGQAVVDVWDTRLASYDTLEHHNFNDASITVLASMVLTLPSDKIPLFCQPFLDAVSAHPKDVAFFIDQLVAHQNILAADSSFWDVWQVFADSILESSWSAHIADHNSAGSKLIESMLFNGDLLGSIKNHLSGHEDQVNKFVSCLPVTPFVLTCFSIYLSKVGGGSLPSAFTIVADMLRSGNATELLTGHSIVPIESLLQRRVYDQQSCLKTDPTLRRAAITILDALIDAGSPNAYKMLDDFGAPLSS